MYHQGRCTYCNQEPPDRQISMMARVFKPAGSDASRMRGWRRIHRSNQRFEIRFPRAVADGGGGAPSSSSSSSSQQRQQLPQRMRLDPDAIARPEDNPDFDDLVLDEDLYRELGLSPEEIEEHMQGEVTDRR